MGIRCLTTMVIATILVFQSGCAGFWKGGDADVVVLMIDKSGSTTELEAENQKKYVEQRISEIPAGTTVIALPITANPLAGDRNNIIKVEMPNVHWYKYHDETKLKAKKRDLTDSIEQMLQETSVANGTAIMDSFRLVEDLLPKDAANIKIEVISDMMETSRIDFYQSCQTLSQQSANIVTEETDSGRLPDLKGAEVRIVGAGVGNKPMLVECRDQVKALWTAYLQAAGATVQSYSPVPAD